MIPPPHLLPAPADPIALDRRRRRQYRLRTLMLASAASAAWLGFLRLPGAGPMVVGALAVVAGVSALFLGAMALAWLGFGLFALFDRAASRRAQGLAPEPGPVDDWWA